MKTVAITGHTGQIGKSLSNEFVQKGYQVVGISRGTGFDLSIKEDRIRAAEHIAECDIFVNLAWPPTQPDILELVWNKWQGNQSKLILNVGTMSTAKPSLMLDDINYYKIKKQLDTKHWQLIDRGHFPKMTLVRAALGVDEDTFDGWAKFLVNLVGQEYHVLDIAYIRIPLT